MSEHKTSSPIARAGLTWIVVKGLIRGSVITVLVSWLCAMVPGSPGLHGPATIRQVGALGTTKTELAVRSWKTWAGEHLQIARLGRIARLPPALELTKADLPWWSVARRTFPSLPKCYSPDAAVPHYYEEYGFGVPWPTMRATWLAEWRTGKLQALFGGIRVPRREWFIPKKSAFRLWKFTTVLPLIPIPLGFAASTVIWATPFVAFEVVRRTWRRRAGVCMVCGYDLRGCTGAICPECGHDTIGGGQVRSGTMQ